MLPAPSTAKITSKTASGRPKKSFYVRIFRVEEIQRSTTDRNSPKVGQRYRQRQKLIFNGVDRSNDHHQSED